MAKRRLQDAPGVILASASPRRAELLATLDLDPVVVATDVDETPLQNESGLELVVRLAEHKVAAGWASWTRRNVAVENEFSTASRWMIVAADTVVEIDGLVLGKPEGNADAERMLMMLSGRVHRVHTGVAVGLATSGCDLPDPLSAVETTDVVMRSLDGETIDWYVGTGEPLDKAGAYGIQGKGSLLVERVTGSYPNVVGLPTLTVDRLCRRLGWPLQNLARSPFDPSQKAAC